MGLPPRGSFKSGSPTDLSSQSENLAPTKKTDYPKLKFSLFLKVYGGQFVFPGKGYHGDWLEQIFYQTLSSITRESINISEILFDQIWIFFDARYLQT